MTWQFMNDSIEYEGETLYRLAGTHRTKEEAQLRVERLRRRGRKAVVRPRPDMVAYGECYAVYAEAPK